MRATEVVPLLVLPVCGWVNQSFDFAIRFLTWAVLMTKIENFQYPTKSLWLFE